MDGGLKPDLGGSIYADIADKRITENVKNALKLVDIELLDHLILTYEEKYATVE
jgi:DNA repair protein RadC